VEVLDMVIMITDQPLEEHLIRDRQARGADRFDEVWEGVYVIGPVPNNEHQELVGALDFLLCEVVVWPRLGRVYPGVNLSDCAEDWTHDYRVPDIAVCLEGGSAQNRGTHWTSADFLVEVVSPGDRTYDKIPFYERLGVGEVLILGRDPWMLELFRLEAGRLCRVASGGPESRDWIASQKVPLSFRLVAAEPRPKLEVLYPAENRQWTV
jgi:Uma2 family endonuclease